MIIQLSDSAPPRLIDADRLDRLHAERSGDPGATMFDDLCSPGPDDDHVWIDVAGLRAATAERSPAAAEPFDAMIAYAAGKGWLDATGTKVRAHIAG